MTPHLTDLIEGWHRTLHAAGVRDGDVHLYIDWIADTVRNERQVWLLRALGMFGIGVALGAAGAALLLSTRLGCG
jgi:hypothetical protein